MSGPSSADVAAMNRTLRQNIETLAERRRRELAQAPLSDKISDRVTAFAGSMLFVALHLVAYGAWAAINLRLVPGLTPWDPSLVMLATAASVEAIFLSTFVLISQNRMMETADRQSALDLHISLLAEHELTRLAALNERIARHLGLAIDDPEFEEIKRDVEPTQVLEVLDASAGRTASGSSGSAG